MRTGVDRVAIAATLPRTDAAVDLIDNWIGIAEENRALFAEQMLVDAARGDVEAALYADSARVFCEASIAHLAAVRAGIVSAGSAGLSLAAFVL